jgi:hypothetical protein
MKSLTPEEQLIRRYDTIESIQSAIVSAGGGFLTRAKIEKMTVGELLNMSISNLVKIKAEYDSETYVKLQGNN